MQHHHCDHQASIGPLITALLASGILACSLVDDDEPPVADTGGGVDVEVCLAQVEAAEAECVDGMSFHSTVQAGGGSMILVDDPGASVGVGPGAWLIEVGAEADYIAAYRAGDPMCAAGCGWCYPGASMCHQGFDENGTPMGCFMCVPYGTPDMGTQCAAFMAACAGVDETDPDEDDGVDETGAESDSGGMELADPETFDCRDWDLEGAVVLDERGDVIVDAAIVELAAAHLGEPLAKCDGTRFRRRSDGYFEVSALASSGLLARIGLARGDVILAVDGEPMRGADRIVSKAMDAFMGARPASELTLVVLRGAATIDMRVRIR